MRVSERVRRLRNVCSTEGGPGWPGGLAEGAREGVAFVTGTGNLFHIDDEAAITLLADHVRRWIDRHDLVAGLVLYSDLKGAGERSQPETSYCGEIQWVDDDYSTSISGATYEEAICDAGELLVQRALKLFSKIALNGLDEPAKTR